MLCHALLYFAMFEQGFPYYFSSFCTNFSFCHFWCVTGYFPIFETSFELILKLTLYR
jgi:hypothetical protein